MAQGDGLGRDIPSIAPVRLALANLPPPIGAGIWASDFGPISSTSKEGGTKYGLAVATIPKRLFGWWPAATNESSYGRPSNTPVQCK